MRRRDSIITVVLLLCACAGGCNTPATVNLFAVDSLTGRPVSGVRVQRTDKKWLTSDVGVTDPSGHLDAVKVKTNDRLTLTRVGYEPIRVMIGFGEAQILPPTGPAEDENARKSDTPMPDADPFPIEADHSITILMRPR